MLTYLPGNSILHRLDPTLNVLLAVLLAAGCFLFPMIWVSAAVLLIDIGLAYIAGCGQWGVRTAVNLFKVTALLFLIQLFSVRVGTELFRLGFLKITTGGLTASVLLALRIVASCIPLALILRVTEPTRLANSLNHHLRIPYKYAFAFATALRFIPIFADEMAEIMEAQTARGVEFDGRSLLKTLRHLLPLCMPLLLSSVRKIEMAAISAELRGFSLR